MTNVAINGLGRIGRATLKIVMDTPGLNLVAANDIGTSESVEYLLKYDTVYGRYEKPVRTRRRRVLEDWRAPAAAAARKRSWALAVETAERRHRV